MAESTGGTIEGASGNGYKVLIPYGQRGIMVRVMETNGGYYRISVPGKQAFTVTGEASADQALTHIPIEESSLDDILRIVSDIAK